jgi:hypothetical protein
MCVPITLMFKYCISKEPWISIHCWFIQRIWMHLCICSLNAPGWENEAYMKHVCMWCVCHDVQVDVHMRNREIWSILIWYSERQDTVIGRHAAACLKPKKTNNSKSWTGLYPTFLKTAGHYLVHEPGNTIWPANMSCLIRCGASTEVKYAEQNE